MTYFFRYCLEDGAEKEYINSYTEGSVSVTFSIVVRPEHLAASVPTLKYY
jgi:hypothetical protein